MTAGRSGGISTGRPAPADTAAAAGIVPPRADTGRPSAPHAGTEGPASPEVATDRPDGPSERRDDLDDLEELEELDFDPDEVPDPDGPAPRIVVFDIGEVLIDENRVWSVWSDLLGVSPLTFAAVLGAAIAQGQASEVVFPHLAPNVEWRDFEDEHERRYGGFRDEDLYPDVRPCLDELRSLGFTIVIAGNQPERRSAQLLALELPHDHLTTSEELGAEKPDPAFFDQILRLVGGSTEPGDLLYVGDRVDNDVLPAAAAGLRTCWLRRGPWGHLQELPEDAEPDLILEGLGELPLLLSQWRGDEI